MNIMTVLGPIAPEDLGFTLPHEHLQCDIYRVTGDLNGLLNDEDVAIEELMAYKQAGGQSVVDLTNRGLGRNHLALRRISLATGIHIVAGCGWYRQPFYSESVDRTRTSELADDMVTDLTEGIDGSDVRAGIIGEIGADKDYLTAGEERVLRAAARAHKKTGAAISTHAIGYPVGLEQLAILREEGVDPKRVIISHCDSYLNLEYHESIIKQGATVEFDSFGKQYLYRDTRRITFLKELLRRGYVSQILLSTDICLRSYLHAGGGHGYDHVPRTIIPALKSAGVSDEEIHIMTVINPRRLLAF